MFLTVYNIFQKNARFLLTSSKNTGINKNGYGEVAQMVEQRNHNPCVGGSIPSFATSYKNSPKGLFFYTRSEESIPPMFQSSDDGAYFRSTGRRNTSSPRFACPITQKAGTLATQGGVVVGEEPTVRPDRA